MEMAFLKRICIVSLFMLLRTCNTDSTMHDSHFSFYHPPIKKLIEPLSYVIPLMLPFVENDSIFHGVSMAWIVIENPTRKIDLNVHGLTIKEEEFRLSRYPYNDTYSLKDYHYSNETETLTFDFETYVSSGFYDIAIGFNGTISENQIGIYRTSCKDCNGAAKWRIETQLQPTAARRVFPCWDEPSLKARFAIAIMHHRNHTVQSNMPMMSQGKATDDVMWTQFHATPPIPTYLVAFWLTVFSCYGRKKYGFTTRLCCRPLDKGQIKIALNTSVNVALYLRRNMKIPPQISEITHIGLPDFPYDSIGNWGLNIYRESHLMYNETLHSIDHKLDVSTYVASMVALQWFGNLVSPTSWTHMWFFQTLALFYGAKAFAETYPDEDIKFMFTYRLQSLAREDNTVYKMKPVMYEANTRDEIDRFNKSYHFSNCLKEYAIMVMLEDAFTENIFQNAAMKYLEKHQFSSATPNDFWKAIQDEKSVQISFYPQPSIVQIVQSWLKQRSLPVMYVTRNKSEHFIFREKYPNTKKDGYNANNLLIPINYVTKSDPASVSFITWLNPYEDVLIQIPIHDWIILNWKHAGYYRVSYDALTLKTLTTYLQSKDYATIHVLSRAHIIEDAHYFWSQQKLSMSRFIELINYMKREQQCAPWYAMQKVLQKMWTFLNIKASSDFNNATLDILEQLLKEVGYMEHPDDAECVKFKRLLATKWACRLFHEKCLEIAEQRLIEHLNDPESPISSPIWEEWTYCNGLVLSNISTWTLVLKEFEETRNMRILEYLGCSGNITVIIRYLNRLMAFDPLQTDVIRLSDEDRQKIYRSTIEKHISRIEVLIYVWKNRIRLMETSLVAAVRYIVEKVYSLPQMDLIYSLVKETLEKEITDPEYYRNWIAPIIDHQYLRIRELEELAH